MLRRMVVLPEGGRHIARIVCRRCRWCAELPEPALHGLRGSRLFRAGVHRVRRPGCGSFDKMGMPGAARRNVWPVTALVAWYRQPSPTLRCVACLQQVYHQEGLSAVRPNLLLGTGTFIVGVIIGALAIRLADHTMLDWPVTATAASNRCSSCENASASGAEPARTLQVSRPSSMLYIASESAPKFATHFACALAHAD